MPHATFIGGTVLAGAVLVLLGWTAWLRAWRRELDAREGEVDDRADHVARAQHELYLERKRVHRERQVWHSVAGDPDRARLGRQVDVLRAELAAKIELLGVITDRDPELVRRAQRALALRREHWRRLATRETLIMQSIPPLESTPTA